MKNILFIALLFSLYTLSSCETTGSSGVQGSPEETMNSFIEKVTANDFEGAKAFASNRTDQTLDALKQAQSMFKDMNKENTMSFGQVDFSQKIEVTCKTTDNKATCDCCEEITGNCKSIRLAQENGKWLVDEPKESNVE